MSLRAILTGVSAALVVVLVGFALSRWVQWLDRRGRGSRSIHGRSRAAFAKLQECLARPGSLTPEETSRIFALFTDLRTYVDQRSDAYAWNTLRAAEAALAAAAHRRQP